jgi:arsenate reductase
MAGILFLCVANSARSQLAEAIAREIAPELDVWSAGSEPTHVRPQVRRVLQELGFNDKGLRSKSMFEVELDEIDVIVTLCREEQCPVLPRKKHHIHWPLPDPASAPDEESDEAYRATRDELKRRLPALLKKVEAGTF